MVDDYFAEGWPGVSEGVHAFMLKQRAASLDRATWTVPTIVPFFVGFNKVLFVADDLSGTYQDALMSGQNIIGSSLAPPPLSHALISGQNIVGSDFLPPSGPKHASDARAPPSPRPPHPVSSPRHVSCHVRQLQRAILNGGWGM